MLPASSKDQDRFDPLLWQRDLAQEAVRAADGLPPDGEGEAAGRQAAAEMLAEAERRLAGSGEAARPVYLLQVPTKLQRAKYRREIRSHGVVGYSDGRLRELIRADLEQAAPDNLADLLALLDRAESPDLETPIDLRALAEQVARLGGRYSQAQADIAFAQEIAQHLAMRHFLVGWENGPGVFRRENGQTADETIALLDAATQVMVGTRIMQLMQLSEHQAKN